MGEWASYLLFPSIPTTHPPERSEIWCVPAGQDVGLSLEKENHPHKCLLMIGVALHLKSHNSIFFYIRVFWWAVGLVHRGMGRLRIHKGSGKMEGKEVGCFGEGQKALHCVWHSLALGDTGGEAVMQQWHQLDTEHSLPGEKTPLLHSITT